VHITLPITACLLVAFALISFASGCRTPTLRIETPGDVSGYRTWNFVDPVSDAIEVPGRVDDDLEPAIARQVEIGLAERGFRRTTTDPDLLVAFHLAVREQWVEQNETGAIQHLPSLHYAPSYDVQATRTELRRYETAELWVVMLDRKDRAVVWRGRFNGRFLDAFAPHLDDAVSQLLAEVSPPRSSGKSRTIIAETPPGIPQRVGQHRERGE
jgi:hypothetical protein